MYSSVYIIGEKDKNVLRVGHRVSSADIDFEIEMLEKLFLSEVAVVRSKKTREGGNYVKIEEDVAVLFYFVDGYHPILNIKTVPEPEECYLAGKMLAKIHNATANYVPKYSRKRTVFSELERVMTNRNQFADYIGGKEFIEQVEKTLLFGQSYDGQMALIHNDYRVDNIFFKNKNEVNAVIDFDWSCFGPIIKDIAHSVLVWSFADGGVGSSTEVIEHFMNGYNSVSNTKVEYDDKFINWIQFSALADTATYFCDRFNEPGFEKRITRSYMYKKFLHFSK